MDCFGKLLWRRQSSQDEESHTEEPDSNMEVPFKHFLTNAANMIIVWETIMLNLSGSDIANCLRVCRGLRWAIRQCLETNSRLRLRADQAAMASSLSKGWIQSKATIAFKGLEEPPGYVSCTLDGNFYNPNRKTIVKLDSYGKQNNIPLPAGIKGVFNVLPTMQEDLVMADLGKGKMALFKILPHEVKEIKYETCPEYAKDQENMQKEPSCCIKYRLFTSEEDWEDSVIVLMKPFYPSLKSSKVVPLYKVSKDDRYSIIMCQVMKR